MLSREYILSLEAGRKADMHIAEEVMNLRCVHWSDEDIWHENDQGEYESVPRYSTDISAAWEVESTIPEEKQRLYAMMLTNIAGTGFNLAHASPLDRCKAALLTTIQGEQSNE